MEVKAVINNKEEILRGIEAEIYLKQGEKAILNRRKYCQDNYDYIVSLEKMQAYGKYAAKNTKDDITYPILKGE